MRLILSIFIAAVLLPASLFAKEPLEIRQYTLMELLWLEPSLKTWKESWRFKNEEGKTISQSDPFEEPHGNQKDENGKTPWEVKQDYIEAIQHPQKLKHYLMRHTQIRFPEGSWVSYDVEKNSLMMNNLPVHHQTLHTALMASGHIAVQVQITFRVVVMPSAEIDTLDRAHPAGIPDAKLVELWTAGKGKTIISQSVKTINGVNAIIECVDDISYPTEMDSSKQQASGETNPIVYGGVETRPIGAIFNVTPTVNPRQDIINLIILPEVADLKKIDANVPKHVEPISPTFTSLNLTTSSQIKNGSTHIIGRSTSRDPEQHVIIMVSASLVDTANVPTQQNQDTQPAPEKPFTSDAHP